MRRFDASIPKFCNILSDIIRYKYLREINASLCISALNSCSRYTVVVRTWYKMSSTVLSLNLIDKRNGFDGKHVEIMIEKKWSKWCSIEEITTLACAWFLWMSTSSNCKHWQASQYVGQYSLLIVLKNAIKVNSLALTNNKYRKKHSLLLGWTV